jgi:endonuclease/exonuclease/phosphatase family metal-dependent hydrolase
MARVRIVSLNIAHGRGLNPFQGLTLRAGLERNLRRIAALLVRLEPDFVALQEIDQRSRWAGNFDQLEFLREATGMPHAAFGVHNRREGLINLAYGNAFLSRFPIVASETVVFGQSRVGEKGFIFGEFAVEGTLLPVVNLHLHFRSRRLRFRQLDRLLDFLRERRLAHGGHWPMLPVVCGDFNTPAGSADVTAALHRHLNDLAPYSMHPRRGRTFPSPLPARLLDFVFLPPRALEPRCQVVRAMVSDHRPVMVDFSLVAGAD